MRMDSLVMISITGLIYAIVLAPEAQVEGLEVIGNTLKHMIVPVMTVALWLIVGPRRQVTFASVFTAIVIPITWPHTRSSEDTSSRIPKTSSHRGRLRTSCGSDEHCRGGGSGHRARSCLLGDRSPAQWAR